MFPIWLFKTGNKVHNLYRGYVGDRPKMSPAPDVQPIDQNLKVLTVAPINTNKTYQSSVDIVNTENTPDAQSNYK